MPGVEHFLLGRFLTFFISYINSVACDHGTSGNTGNSRIEWIRTIRTNFVFVFFACTTVSTGRIDYDNT